MFLSFLFCGSSKLHNATTTTQLLNSGRPPDFMIFYYLEEFFAFWSEFLIFLVEFNDFLIEFVIFFCGSGKNPEFGLLENLLKNTVTKSPPNSDNPSLSNYRMICLKSTVSSPGVWYSPQRVILCCFMVWNREQTWKINWKWAKIGVFPGLSRY